MWLRRAIRRTIDGPVEGDLKTHRQRRVALDAETAAALREHRDRCLTRAEEAGDVLDLDAFVFSPVPDGSAFPPGRQDPAAHPLACAGPRRDRRRQRRRARRPGRRPGRGRRLQAANARAAITTGSCSARQDNHHHRGGPGHRARRGAVAATALPHLSVSAPSRHRCGEHYEQGDLGRVVVREKIPAPRRTAVRRYSPRSTQSHWAIGRSCVDSRNVDLEMNDRPNSAKRPSLPCSGSVTRGPRTGCGQAITKNFKNGDRVRQVAVNPSGNE